jgi:hypothetical protein
MKLALTAVVVCLFAGVARAEERYPTRIIVADAASVAVATAGVVITARASDVDSQVPRSGVVLTLAGTLSYLVTPAILHVGRRNPGGAVRSVAARIGLPMLLGFGGLLATAGSADTASYLALAGAAGAMVLDWAVFAKTRPFMMPTRDGVQIGFARAF